MRKPSYCTNELALDCWDCPQQSKGFDCKGNSIAAREMGGKGGTIGGRSKSAAKHISSIRNGRKGGRPRKDGKPNHHRAEVPEWHIFSGRDKVTEADLLAFKTYASTLGCSVPDLLDSCAKYYLHTLV